MSRDDRKIAQKRLMRLLRHFLQSPALPSFAWIKAVELLILATIGDALLMVGAAVLITLSWAWLFDDIEDEVFEEEGDDGDVDST